MTRTATTSVPLHPLLAERWSPRAFDTAPVSDDELRALLEAARWAPSGGNHQPSRFLVGRGGPGGQDAAYKALFDSLAPGNQVWASHAPLLIAGAVRVRNEDGGERAVGPFELGLAVSSLTVQATALGLVVHAMGGFDHRAAERAFDVPDDHRVYVVLAVGRLGDPDSLPELLAHREVAERHRIPLEHLAFGATWGEPAL